MDHLLVGEHCSFGQSCRSACELKIDHLMRKHLGHGLIQSLVVSPATSVHQFVIGLVFTRLISS